MQIGTKEYEIVEIRVEEDIDLESEIKGSKFPNLVL